MKKTQYNNLVSSYARVLFHVSGSRLGIIRKEVEFLLAFLRYQRDVFVVPISSYDFFCTQKRSDAFYK